jgi:phosphoribosylamine---glycine ligase
MNVLVVDNGARGHALADKAAQAPKCNQLWAPSVSPGILKVARPAIDSVGDPLETTNVEGLMEFAKREHIGLTLVGQEEPLALGIIDAFEAEGLKIFGPSGAATEIETSLEFAAQLTDELGIPTAKRNMLEDYDQIIEYAHNEGFPIVLKANGPVQGKGVKICPDLITLKTELGEFRLNGRYGQPGQQVLLEEFRCTSGATGRPTACSRLPCRTTRLFMMTTRGR